MKEPANRVGIAPGMVGSAVPPRSGLLAMIGETARRLTRRETRAVAVEMGAKPDERKRREPGTRRSEIDAGVTGGMTLLFDGFREGRRR